MGPAGRMRFMYPNFFVCVKSLIIHLHLHTESEFIFPGSPNVSCVYMLHIPINGLILIGNYSNNIFGKARRGSCMV